MPQSGRPVRAGPPTPVDLFIVKRRTWALNGHVSRSVTMLIVGCAVGLSVAILFAFTLIGLIGEVVAVAAGFVLIANLTVRALHR